VGAVEDCARTAAPAAPPDGATVTDRVEDSLAELARLAADLGPALAPPGHAEFLQAVTQAVRKLPFGGRLLVSAGDQDGERLEFVAAAGAGAEQLFGVRIPAGQGIVGWILASGQPIQLVVKPAWSWQFSPGGRPEPVDRQARVHRAVHELADLAYFRGVMLVGAVDNVPAPSYPVAVRRRLLGRANQHTDPFAITYNPAPPVEFGAPAST
jgi:hypothetical protein